MACGPIFIGGVSFSGKTQLRLLLNLHSNILITRHTYLWRKFYGRYGDLGTAENLEACLDAICPSKQGAALKPNRTRIRDEFRSGPADYSRLFCLFHHHFAQAAGKGRWGVQQSFVECDADLLFNSMPDARILHVIRSPFERIEESVGKSRRFGKVGAETALWQHSSRWADRNQRLYPDQYLVVRWESLKQQPEAGLREVCAFIGVDYEPGMLVGVDFASEHANGYRGLSRAEKSFIQIRARQEIDQFDYSPQYRPRRFGEILSYAFFDYPVNSITALWMEKTMKYPFPSMTVQNKGIPTL